MKLKILWVGKSRDPWVKDAIDEYAGRIRRYMPLELIDIRDEKGAEAEEMRRRECERLEKQVSPGATLILLDERGEQMDSPGLASFVGKQRDGGEVNVHLTYRVYPAASPNPGNPGNRRD